MITGFIGNWRRDTIFNCGLLAVGQAERVRKLARLVNPVNKVKGGLTVWRHPHGEGTNEPQLIKALPFGTTTAEENDTIF